MKCRWRSLSLKGFVAILPQQLVICSFVEKILLVLRKCFEIKGSQRHAEPSSPVVYPSVFQVWLVLSRFATTDREEH